MAILRILLVLALASPLAAQEYDSVQQTSEMVAMRDGVRLATDIYRPARGGAPAEGKFPVLIYRTPYNKEGLRKAATLLATHGYVVLAQDCRGRFASEGEFYAFINEGRDGYDTIEWAAARPWSNGKVGTLGASYLAWDQYHAAMYRPPHLEAMFANVGGANFFSEYAYPGGVPNLGWPLWILRSAMTSPRAAREKAAAEHLAAIMKNPGDWLLGHPAKRGAVLEAFPEHLKMYEALYAHPTLDALWKERGFYTAGYYREMKDVPIFFLSGWYDYFAEGVLGNFASLSRMQKSPKRLWMGPWPHGIGRADCGDVFFGPSAAVNESELVLDWFDHWLKGKPLVRLGSQRVRVFRMGGGDGKRDAEGRLQHGGEWVSLRGWPPSSKPLRYYLHAAGELRTTPPSLSKPSTFVFDPDDPVPTIGGRYGVGGWTPPCAQDQVCNPKTLGCKDAKPLNQRTDVLSYVTEPLAAPLDVAGKVQARLWVSSDAVDTDFTAKLMDVYPDGYALILADGQLRMRYRKSLERTELMKPGAVYEITIDLNSTSNRFAAGHRIRLDISSSNFPKFEPNPNTGEPQGRWTRKVKARNTVYHQPGRASYLELPAAP